MGPFLYCVRVRLTTPSVRTYFDLANIEAETDSSAVQQAEAISVDELQMPIRRIRCHVLHKQPIIDC